MRNVFLGISTLIFIGILSYFYFQFDTSKIQKDSVFKSIPGSTYLFVKFDNSKALSHQLRNTNLIWEELKTSDSFKQFDDGFSIVDSILRKDEILSPIYQQSGAILCLSQTGANSFDFLLTLSIPIIQNQSIDWENKMDQYFPNWQNDSRLYDEATIYNINAGWYFSSYKGCLLYSPSAILIEDAIRQLNAQNSLYSNSSFQRIHQTAGSDREAHIYFNVLKLSEFLKIGLNDKSADKSDLLGDFGDWSTLDFRAKSNFFECNGFIQSSDSMDTYLNLYKNQSPQKLDIAEFIPKKASLFLHFGFGNFKQLRSDFSSFLSIKSYGIDRAKIKQWFDESIQKNFTNKIAESIGNELAYVVLENINGTIDDNEFLVFELKEKKQLSKLLNAQADTSKKVNKLKVGINKLWNLMIPYELDFEGEYFTIRDKYLIIGDSEKSVLKYLKEIELDKTLQMDGGFDRFREHLASEANITFYVSPARFSNQISNFSSINSFQSEISKGILSKLEGFAFQISHEGNNLFYANSFLKYNPEVKNETATLWELELDTSMSMKPFLFTNHYTNAKEILVQDNGYNLYLISNTGKILWKRRLKEKVVGSFHVIDRYKNNKFQIMFATQSNIMMIDRNGKDVEDWPIKIENGCATDIAIMDYDNDRNYRVLVSDSAGNILNYTIEGKQVRGWKFKGKSRLIQAPFYFSHNRKDYIGCISKDGKARFLNRKGEDRLKIKSNLSVGKGKRAQLVKGKDLQSHYLIATDSVGTIIKLYLNDKIEYNKISNFSKDHLFYLHNNNGDINYVFIDGNSLKVFDKLGAQKFEFDLPFSKSKWLHEFNLGEGFEIGIVDELNAKIYLITQEEEIHDEFPISGISEFTINDINNDGTLELLVGSKNHQFLVYSITE